MTSRDFLYWLNGFFELTDLEGIALDQRKIQIITNHLNLVYKYEKKPTLPFVIWLKGFLVVSGQTVTSVDQTDRIRLELAANFLHEIDPTFGGSEMQDQLNVIHTNGIMDNYPPESDNTHIRC